MKMNKKFMIPLFGILLVGMAFAGVLVYQGQFNDTFTSSSPVTVTGLEVADLGDVSGGETFVGSPFNLENIEIYSVLVGVSNNAEDGIDVEYKGTLELSSKDISTWALTDDKATIEYTIIGDEFSYDVVSSNIDLTDYTLIYYKDNAENSNDEDRLTTIGSNEGLTTSFPHADDWNVGELANYCDNGYDSYNSCKGAKLWFVKTSDIVDGDLTWSNMASYLYETDLVQFSTTGEIVMYPGMSLDFTPEYTLDINFVGETTVTNSVQNIALA